MKVFDSENHEIGKVDYVKLVETDPATGQPLAADIDGARRSATTA